uniref:Uncharacterized protein n=1 Tax=Ciona intestinalis TaxID=7719 RepID=H2XSZ5_CIOIN
MDKSNLFILAWRGNDSRYNTGFLFYTPRACLQVTTYVTLMGIYRGNWNNYR